MANKFYETSYSISINLFSTSFILIQEVVMRIFIAVFLLTSTMVLYSCSDVNGISEPDQERTIDWVIHNRPQDLLAVIAEFPDDEIIPGKTKRSIVLIDYYNPQTYKIVSDTTYLPEFVVFSPDKKKIIFGDDNYYISDAGPTLVLYDLEENTFLRIDDKSDPLPDEFFLPGIDPVWNYEGTGFYFTQVPAWGYQNLYYYDFLTNRSFSIHSGRQQKTYVVDIVGPDTLIVFSNDSLKTGQPEGFYYMSTEGEFLSRINIETALYRRPGKHNTSIGSIIWNELIKMFIISEPGNFIPGGGIGRRIAISNKDNSFYKYFPLDGVHREYLLGVSPDKNLIIMKAPGVNDLVIKIMKLNYETGIYQEFFSVEMIPSCIGFMVAFF